MSTIVIFHVVLVTAIGLLVLSNAVACLMIGDRRPRSRKEQLTTAPKPKIVSQYATSNSLRSSSRQCMPGRTSLVNQYWRQQTNWEAAK